MNIIIAGGTGLIGRRLTRLLHANGHAVTILTRSPEFHRDLEPLATLVTWNARTAEGWAHLVNTHDAIVNLVGQDISGPGFFPNRWTPERRQVFRSSRIDAGQAVTQAVRLAHRRPSVVVQASGISIYGSTGDRPITEQDPPGSTFMARLAVDWEASSRPVEALGVRHVIVRSGVNFSLEGGALPRMLLPFRLYAGGPMGSGRQYLPWIHPHDEAAAILFLITRRDAQGPFNLVAPQPTTYAQVGRAIARLLHRPYWLPMPAFAMRLAFGEVADVVLTGQRAEPQRLQQMGFQFRYPNLETALADVLTPAPSPA